MGSGNSRTWIEVRKGLERTKADQRAGSLLPGGVTTGGHHEIQLQRLIRQEQPVLPTSLVPSRLLVGHPVGGHAVALPVQVLLEVARLVFRDGRRLRPHAVAAEQQRRPVSRDRGGAGLRISATTADRTRPLFRAFRLVIVTLFPASVGKSPGSGKRARRSDSTGIPGRRETLWHPTPRVVGAARPLASGPPARAPVLPAAVGAGPR